MRRHPSGLSTAVMICVFFALPGIANAALVDRGGGLIYDTDLNITWLADANYAYTSGYDTQDATDGLMTHAYAMASYTPTNRTNNIGFRVVRSW